MILAVVIALALSLQFQPAECPFPIDLALERNAGGLTAMVESLDGDIAVADVEFKLVRLQGDASTTLLEGNLTEALQGEVVFHPLEPDETFLQVGDYVSVDSATEDTHLLLVSHEGVPLGWTAQC